MGHMVWFEKEQSNYSIYKEVNHGFYIVQNKCTLSMERLRDSIKNSEIQALK